MPVSSLWIVLLAMLTFLAAPLSAQGQTNKAPCCPCGAACKCGPNCDCLTKTGAGRVGARIALRGLRGRRLVGSRRFVGAGRGRLLGGAIGYDNVAPVTPIMPPAALGGYSYGYGYGYHAAPVYAAPLAVPVYPAPVYAYPSYGYGVGVSDGVNIGSCRGGACRSRIRLRR